METEQGSMDKSFLDSHLYQSKANLLQLKDLVEAYIKKNDVYSSAWKIKPPVINPQGFSPYPQKLNNPAFEQKASQPAGLAPAPQAVREPIAVPLPLVPKPGDVDMPENPDAAVPNPPVDPTAPPQPPDDQEPPTDDHPENRKPPESTPPPPTQPLLVPNGNDASSVENSLKRPFTPDDFDMVAKKRFELEIFPQAGIDRRAQNVEAVDTETDLNQILDEHVNKIDSEIHETRRQIDQQTLAYKHEIRQAQIAALKEFDEKTSNPQELASVITKTVVTTDGNVANHNTKTVQAAKYLVKSALGALLPYFSFKPDFNFSFDIGSKYDLGKEKQGGPAWTTDLGPEYDVSMERQGGPKANPITNFVSTRTDSWLDSFYSSLSSKTSTTSAMNQTCPSTGDELGVNQQSYETTSLVCESSFNNWFNKQPARLDGGADTAENVARLLKYYDNVMNDKSLSNEAQFAEMSKIMTAVNNLMATDQDKMNYDVTDSFSQANSNSMFATKKNVCDNTGHFFKLTYLAGPDVGKSSMGCCYAQLPLSALTDPNNQQATAAVVKAKEIVRLEATIKNFEMYIKDLTNNVLLSNSVEERRARNALLGSAKELIKFFKLEPSAFNDWQDVLFEKDPNAFALKIENRVFLDKLHATMPSEQFNRVIEGINKSKTLGVSKALENYQIPNVDTPEAISTDPPHIQTIESFERPWYTEVKSPIASLDKPKKYPTSDMMTQYEQLKYILQNMRVTARDSFIKQVDEFSPEPVKPVVTKVFEDKMNQLENFDSTEHNYYRTQLDSTLMNINGLLKSPELPQALVDFVSNPDAKYDSTPFGDFNTKLLAELNQSVYLFNQINTLLPVSTIRPLIPQTGANSRAIFLSSLLERTLPNTNTNNPTDNIDFKTIYGKYVSNNNLSPMGLYCLAPQNPLQEIVRNAQIAETSQFNLASYINANVLPLITTQDLTFDMNRYQQTEKLRNTLYQDYVELANREIAVQNPKSKFFYYYKTDTPDGVADLDALEFVEAFYLGKIPLTIKDLETISYRERGASEMVNALSEIFAKNRDTVLTIDRCDWKTIQLVDHYLKMTGLPLKDFESYTQPYESESFEEFRERMYRLAANTPNEVTTLVGGISAITLARLMKNYAPGDWGTVKGYGQHSPHQKINKLLAVKKILTLMKKSKQTRKICGVCRGMSDKMYRPSVSKDDKDDLCEHCHENKELTANGVNPYFEQFQEYDNSHKEPEKFPIYNEYEEPQFLETMKHSHIIIGKWNAKWFERLVDALLYQENHSVTPTFKANLIKLVSTFLKQFPNIKPSKRHIRLDMFQTRDTLIHTLKTDPGILANYVL